MKKLKIAFWIIVFGFVGLVIFQNKDFFMSESRLMIDLGFFYYETPFLANAIFFVAFFLVGYFDLLFFQPIKTFQGRQNHQDLQGQGDQPCGYGIVIGKTALRPDGAR